MIWWERRGDNDTVVIDGISPFKQILVYLKRNDTHWLSPMGWVESQKGTFLQCFNTYEHTLLTIPEEARAELKVGDSLTLMSKELGLEETFIWGQVPEHRRSELDEEQESMPYAAEAELAEAPQQAEAGPFGESLDDTLHESSPLSVAASKIEETLKVPLDARPAMAEVASHGRISPAKIVAGIVAALVICGGVFGASKIFSGGKAEVPAIRSAENNSITQGATDSQEPKTPIESVTSDSELKAEEGSKAPKSDAIKSDPINIVKEPPAPAKQESVRDNFANKNNALAPDQSTAPLVPASQQPVRGGAVLTPNARSVNEGISQNSQPQTELPRIAEVPNPVVTPSQTRSVPPPAFKESAPPPRIIRPLQPQIQIQPQPQVQNQTRPQVQLPIQPQPQRQALPITQPQPQVAKPFREAAISEGIVTQPRPASESLSSRTEGVVTGEKQVVESKIIKQAVPIYPGRASNRVDQDVRVIVAFDLSAKGVPESLTVESLDYDGFYKAHFSRAAIAAVKKFRYSPRLEDGQPVADTSRKISIVFAANEE